MENKKLFQESIITLIIIQQFLPLISYIQLFAFQYISRILVIFKLFYYYYPDGNKSVLLTTAALSHHSVYKGSYLIYSFQKVNKL